MIEVKTDENHHFLYLHKKTNQQWSGERKCSRSLATSLLIRLRRTTRSLCPFFKGAARLREMASTLAFRLWTLTVPLSIAAVDGKWRWTCLRRSRVFSVPSTARSTPQGGINYRQPEGPAQPGALFLLLLLHPWKQGIKANKRRRDIIKKISLTSARIKNFISPSRLQNALSIVGLSVNQRLFR